MSIPKEEEKLLNAQSHDRQLKTTAMNVNWNIKQTKNESKKIKLSNDQKIKTELIYTNQEIKLRRRQKLNELYLLECEK